MLHAVKSFIRLSLSLVVLLTVFVFVVAPQHGAHAATLQVPQQHATIQAAHNAAASGDIIKVAPGNYSGFIVSKQVTIEGETYDRNNPKNNTVRINGQIYIEAVGNNWTWDQGPVIRGFYIVGLDPVRGKRTPYTLEYSFVEAAGQGNDGVSFESGGGIIRGNIVDPGGDDNIDIDTQNMNILIEDNILKNSNQDGIEVRQQETSIPQRVTLTIRNNRFENNGQDGLQIMDYDNFTNRRYILERNLFIGVGSKGNGAAIGIMVGQDTTQNFSAAAMPEALYAVNNTFLNGDAGISGGANLIAINNIFSGNTVFDIKNVNGASKILRSVFAATPKQQGTNNLDSATTKIGNPQLDGNYVPQNGSPAIDAGLASYQHTYTFSGQSFNDTVVNITSGQFTGSAPDVGWKESGATGNPTPTAPVATNTPVPTNPNCGPIGDINCSGRVNLEDLQLLLAAYATTNQAADLDQSGLVSILDLSLLLKNFQF